MDVCKGTSSLSKRSTLIGVNRKTLKRHQQAESETHQETPACKRRRENKQVAAGFFEDVAMPVPDKKLVSKRSGKSAPFLQKPLKDVFADFKSATGTEISFSNFAKHRPKNVKLMAQARLRQCLCEYCTNVELKITVLNNHAVKSGKPECRIRHEREAVKLTLCNSSTKACHYRECQAGCGAIKLGQHLAALPQDEDITWHRWETKNVRSNGKLVSTKLNISHQEFFMYMYLWLLYLNKYFSTYINIVSCFLNL